MKKEKQPEYIKESVRMLNEMGQSWDDVSPLAGDMNRELEKLKMVVADAKDYLAKVYDGVREDKYYAVYDAGFCLKAIRKVQEILNKG
jgi:hypothetical protein